MPSTSFGEDATVAGQMVTKGERPSNHNLLQSSDECLDWGWFLLLLGRFMFLQS